MDGFGIFLIFCVLALLVHGLTELIVSISRKWYGGGHVNTVCQHGHIGPIAEAKPPGKWARCQACGNTMDEQERQTFWRLRREVLRIKQQAIFDAQTRTK